MTNWHAKLRGRTASTGALLLLTAAAVGLTACGDDSGGGASAPALHAGGLDAAAGAAPISGPTAGSVTQSSHHAEGRPPVR